MPARHVEHVELSGHILDSLLLPKVLDVMEARSAAGAAGCLKEGDHLRPGGTHGLIR